MGKYVYEWNTKPLRRLANYDFIIYLYFKQYLLSFPWSVVIRAKALSSSTRISIYNAKKICFTIHWYNFFLNIDIKINSTEINLTYYWVFDKENILQNQSLPQYYSREHDYVLKCIFTKVWIKLLPPILFIKFSKI